MERKNKNDETRELSPIVWIIIAVVLMIIGAVTIMTIVGTKEDKETRWKVFKEYFEELKGIDRKLYNKIRHRSLAAFAFTLPGYSLKSFASRNVYKIFQKRLKLG